MTEYSEYRGRSIGRVLHALHTYCKVPGLDSSTVGDGVIKLHGEVIATYKWSDDLESDVPEFIFVDKRWNREQTIVKPFLDFDCCQSPSFIVQEIRSKLTFDEALLLRWIRDEHNSDWSLLRTPLKDKIIESIAIATWRYPSEEWYQKYWQHFALCAIMDI